jgi:hypothetical protein
MEECARVEQQRKDASPRLHFAAHERLALAAVLSAVNFFLRVMERY